MSAVNWLAVIVATVVYFVLDAVMFAPQLPTGRAWIDASGYESPPGGAMSSNLFYIVPAVTAFVWVVATALLADPTGTRYAGSGWCPWKCRNRGALRRAHP